VVHSRTLAVFVGVLSLLLGLWAVLGDIASMGAAAGAMGLIAGVLALVSGEPAQTTSWEGEVSDKEGTTDSGAGTDFDQRMLHPPSAGTGKRSTAPTDDSRAKSPERPDGDLLTDPVTDLFSEAYLRVALDSRLASARRHLRPVAVALLEVTEGIPEDTVVPAPPDRVADAIRETVREADIACRMNDGRFAVILEDTPENGAVWTVERIRRNLVSRFGHHTLWAGVACYPAHAFDSTELMAQVRMALDAAREWKQDRIEVAVAD
jgi:two-component system cell cycle response regulator